jgi:flavin reductase (DIM6/NTAB) family NADH-FMN oxidoreductase RutF/rubredoxin
MKQWRCTICDYIHVGDAPPEKCPVCGAGPEYFEEISDSPAGSGNNETTDSGDLRAVHSRIQEVLFRVPSGIFVVTTVADGKYNGMINNTVFQITDQPLQVLLGMDKSHLTTEMIIKSNVFAVLFLRPDQIQLIKRFGFRSGRETEKFSGIEWHPGITGVPILDDAAGYLECKVQPGKRWDAGTHFIFLAKALSGAIQPEVNWLTYQEYRRRKSELW